jgi:hypothetical protein
VDVEKEIAMSFGQENTTACRAATQQKSGPYDQKSCEQYQFDSAECTPCLNTMNQLNAAVALDNGYMWTHRIVPGLIVGLAVGYFLGKR